MSFKKYVISMIICAVTIFVMIFNAFVPVVSYASIGLEQEFLKYWTSWGVDTGIPKLPSYYQNCVGWSSCVNNWNKFCSYNYANTFYYTYVNKDGSSVFRIYKYDYLVNQNYVGYIKFNSFVSATLSTSINNNGLEIVNISLNLSGSSDTFTVSSNPSVISSSSTKYYISFSGSGANTDNSYNDNNIDFFAKVKAFGSWLLNGVEDVGNLIIDGDYGKFWNELQENNKRYLKNTLNTSDDDIIEDVYRNFLDGNLGSMLLGDGSHLSSDQITAISNTLNKMQEVYNNNVSVRYDNDTNNYYITPSTAYNNYTSKQITDYYNNYIAYNYNNTYNNYTVVDFSTTNSLLGEINANIINCHMTLNSINTNLNSSFTTSINNIFAIFEVDLKSIFDDFIFKLDTTINTGSSSDIDLTSVIDILTNIKTDVNSLVVAFADFDFNAIVGGFANIDSNFNVLGGVIAGAINTAWADIKGELKLLIEGINFKFGDISIGDSTSSDDDTSITNKIKINFDSLVDKLNIKLKGLFDDLKVSLDDLFSDIHITIDKDNTKDDTADTPIAEDDFWKQVKTILVGKVPLYAQCIDLLSPVTTVNYNQLTGGGLLLTEDSTTIQETSIDYYNNTDLFDTYDKKVFNGLAIVTLNVADNVVGVKVPINLTTYGVDKTCYAFDTTPYTSSNYINIVSNIILAICYLDFKCIRKYTRTAITDTTSCLYIY